MSQDNTEGHGDSPIREQLEIVRTEEARANQSTRTRNKFVMIFGLVSMCISTIAIVVFTVVIVSLRDEVGTNHQSGTGNFTVLDHNQLLICSGLHIPKCEPLPKVTVP